MKEVLCPILDRSALNIGKLGHGFEHAFQGVREALGLGGNNPAIQEQLKRITLELGDLQERDRQPAGPDNPSKL